VLSDAERHRAAVHESGHAVVAAAAGRSEDVHRVSILARGRGLGLTSLLRLDSDAVLFTGSDLRAKLGVAFGGLAAEELVLGEASTGAEQDLEHATGLAREIVGRYGMSERIGRVRLFASDAEEYLGTQSGLSTLSERTHEDFDTEVRALLDHAEESARGVLERNREVLDRLAERLLDAETLEGDALAAELAGVK
jgi:cell division protease FtsH